MWRAIARIGDDNDDVDRFMMMGFTVHVLGAEIAEDGEEARTY